jgi:Ca2+-binding RTX toxin-like protein
MRRLPICAAALALATLHAPLPAEAHAGHGCGGKPVSIHGSPGNDVIHGTPGDDVIAGDSGDDTIHGLGGNDFLCGDSGTDVLVGGEGLDYCNGGTGVELPDPTCEHNGDGVL